MLRMGGPARARSRRARNSRAPGGRLNPASCTRYWRRPTMARTKTAPISATRTQARRRPPPVSRPAAAGAAGGAPGLGRESGKSPDSVRFWRCLQSAQVFFRAAPGLLASPPRLHFEIRAAPDPDPGTLFLVGDHRGITGRIQTRAQIRRHPCLGNYWQPDHPFFRFVVE